jgi:excisionase family DNA binding protein
MKNISSEKLHSLYPTEEDILMAKELSRKLAKLDIQSDVVNLRIGSIKQPLKLPEPILNLLLDIIDQMAQGNAISLLPHQKELTTQVAADLLNVSRPYLVQLLEHGDIPFRKIGTKRRVLAKDLFVYKTKIDNQRYQTLEKLTEEAQKLDQGYDDDE